ncbi:hypothetical protein Zm00014a_023235 [Zea mays]|uniref:Uncharacterized protein n=1 Tax=Zea mays TaxID=4577 RepID=A0A3L6EUU7_MAIZE|nr:hypothetical protein Zm00014a_023235 [Zea mays]
MPVSFLPPSINRPKLTEQEEKGGSEVVVESGPLVQVYPWCLTPLFVLTASSGENTGSEAVNCPSSFRSTTDPPDADTGEFNCDWAQAHRYWVLRRGHSAGGSAPPCVVAEGGGRWSFILYGASRIHLLQKHHKSCLGHYTKASHSATWHSQSEVLKERQIQLPAYLGSGR